VVGEGGGGGGDGARVCVCGGSCKESLSGKVT